MTLINLVVVFATDFDGTSFGGITEGLKEFARNLSPDFHLIIAGVGPGRPGLPIQKSVDGVDLTVLPIFEMPQRRMRIPLNLVFTGQLFRFKWSIEEQADLLLPRRMESALPFIIAKRKPVILTIHGSSKHLDFVRTGFLRWRIVQWIYLLVEGFVLSKVDRVVLVSHAGYHYYIARHPRLRHKFLVIPNYINMSEFSSIDRTVARLRYRLGDTDLVIAYVGRLSREKQVDLLISAFADISRERSNAHLFIAGDGEEEHALRAQVARLNLHNVRFLGRLTRENVRILLSCVDVVAMLSLFEGFSNAALEALACGVPVVTTDVGGMRELLGDHLEQFIVSRSDPELIRSKILEAAYQRPKLIQACLEQAKRFDAKVIMPRLEDLYKSLRNGS